MGKVRSVEYEGGIKTRYIQESDGKLTINNEQNVNPLLKRNKALYNHNDGFFIKS
jgi:hypothetical protein